MSVYDTVSTPRSLGERAQSDDVSEGLRNGTSKQSDRVGSALKNEPDGEATPTRGFTCARATAVGRCRSLVDRGAKERSLKKRGPEEAWGIVAQKKKRTKIAEKKQDTMKTWEGETALHYAAVNASVIKGGPCWGCLITRS